MNTGRNRIRCEVCITFRGSQSCRTAAASTRELALRTATENACAQISSGVTDSNQCNNTPPDSVRWPSGSFTENTHPDCRTRTGFGRTALSEPA